MWEMMERKSKGQYRIYLVLSYLKIKVKEESMSMWVIVKLVHLPHILDLCHCTLLRLHIQIAHIRCEMVCDASIRIRI